MCACVCTFVCFVFSNQNAVTFQRGDGGLMSNGRYVPLYKDVSTVFLFKIRDPKNATGDALGSHPIIGKTDSTRRC